MFTNADLTFNATRLSSLIKITLSGFLDCALSFVLAGFLSRDFRTSRFSCQVRKRFEIRVSPFPDDFASSSVTKRKEGSGHTRRKLLRCGNRRISAGEVSIRSIALNGYFNRVSTARVFERMLAVAITELSLLVIDFSSGFHSVASSFNYIN